MCCWNVVVIEFVVQIFDAKNLNGIVEDEDEKILFTTQ